MSDGYVPYVKFLPPSSTNKDVAYYHLVLQTSYENMRRYVRDHFRAGGDGQVAFRMLGMIGKDSTGLEVLLSVGGRRIGKHTRREIIRTIRDLRKRAIVH